MFINAKSVKELAQTTRVDLSFKGLSLSFQCWRKSIFATRHFKLNLFKLKKWKDWKKLSKIYSDDESGFYPQKASTVISMLEGIYFRRETFANVKYQMLVQVHVQMPFDCLIVIHQQCLCKKCLLMYFTFVTSQIELWTKVDPLWYSFSLWSEYFDIVFAPGEPFPLPWDWTQ